MTEIRTTSFFSGTASVYSYLGAWIDVLGSATMPLHSGIQNAFESANLLVGSITGTGSGGNQLLFDVTGTVASARLAGEELLGFRILDEIDDGLGLGILGSNYNSGLPSCVEPAVPCQYYASSFYEYPI